MRQAKQTKEVAGCLNAAGHDLARAVKAARKVSEEAAHDLAQLECAVQLQAKAWFKRLDLLPGGGKP